MSSVRLCMVYCIPVHGVYVRLFSASCHLSEKDTGKKLEVAIYRSSYIYMYVCMCVCVCLYVCVN